MSFFKMAVIVVCLLAGFNYFQRQGKWQAFVSEEWAFSVMMPGLPSDMVRKQPTAIGSIDIHNFIREKGGAVYAVSVNRFPVVVSAQKIDYVLGGVGADIEKLTNGKVWSQTSIVFGEYPGRDVKARDLEIGKLLAGLTGKYDMNMRVYLANSKLYQIMMLTPTGSPFPEKDGALFFDSFKIR